MSAAMYGSARRAAVARSTSAEKGDRWEDHALCQGDLARAEVFYRKDDASKKAAKKVCRQCPVREQCLQWALDTHQDSGVLGGMTEGERRAIHRRFSRPDLVAEDGFRTRTEQLLADPQAYRDLVAQGLKESAIARMLSTNVATVKKVGLLLAERDADAKALDGVMAK